MNHTTQGDGSPAGGSLMLFLHNFVTAAQIGIYSSERSREQRVRIDIAVRVQDCFYPYSARNVLDYNVLRDGVRKIIDLGHIEYQETLCQHILSMCLSLPRVSMARVRVAKLDAFPDCSEVGCEMERSRGEDSGQEYLESYRDARPARSAAKG